MASKKELETQINEKLETDIEWSELKKDDLEEFTGLVEDEEFVKLVVANYAGNTAGGLTKSAVTSWKPGKGISVLTSDSKALIDMLF